MKCVQLMLLGVGLGLSLPVVARSTVNGFVYQDINGNGVRDAQEPGIADVAVTNGRAVCLTGSDGQYALPATDDMIVSVIKPSGYAVPLNATNQPQFYYIHKPDGSPKLRHAGVAPTGPLPASVDFPLIPQEESKEFTALIFGDPQPDSLADLRAFEKAIVDEVAGTTDAVFGISLGDLGAISLFPEYRKTIAKIGIPWYNVIGNHDMNTDIPHDRWSDETFEANFGPATYAFNYGDAHFIVLDNVLYPDPRGQQGYYGGLREDILDFVENDLKFVPTDKLVVISMHIPPAPFEEPDPFRDADRLRLFELLANHRYTLSLSAHVHGQNHHFYGADEGWKGADVHHHFNVGTTSGSVYKGPKDRYGTPEAPMSDGTPKGYLFLHINGNQYTYDYKVSGEPADYRMRINIPKIVPQVKKFRAEAFVNFFQGSPRDILEYRVDNGPWQPMAREPRLDKYLLDLEYEWDHAEELPWGVRLASPVPSSHIWTAPMPSSFSLGEHTFEVRATDWLGRIYTASRTFKMVK